ncbi:MAG: cation:proton antiporter [Candidatus Binatia bacterium]
MFDNVFYEMAVLLIVAAGVGAVATHLRQPLIVAFIAVGILVGPTGLGWVRSSEQIDLLAQMGITLLLFLVGLQLDPRLIRSVGPVALTTGLGQVVFTSGIGYVLALALGLGALSALYVAVALTFSSTIIIVKLLSDKREIDSLHGRIAIGFLIVQDLVVVLVMIGLSALGAGGPHGGFGRAMLLVLALGLAFLGSVGLLMRFVLPRLLSTMVRSRELLILFAIAFAVALAAVGAILGISKEVGAFLAGVALASTPYRDAIGARLVSLRDFLLLFFFIDLGAKLDLGILGAQVATGMVLSIFVLVGNPLVVMILMGAMGYRKRTGFLAGLAVAQISEFSLILGTLGLNLGHITAEDMGLITLVGLITIGLSTYMILYSHVLYEFLTSWLAIFERTVPHREHLGDTSPNTTPVGVILFGLGRYGNSLADGLRRNGLSVVGVDFDPQAIAAWHAQGFAAQYGDAEDPEFPITLPLSRTQWVISAIPQYGINVILLQALRAHGYGGRVALTAHTTDDAKLLHEAGADAVLLPFADAAERAVEVLTSEMGRGHVLGVAPGKTHGGL